MNWASYILRRIGLAIVQVATIWFFTFVILRLIPANPAYRIAGFNTSPENIHRIEVELGLNKSIWAQMWDYIVALLHGDLGHSLSTGNDVWDDLTQRVPATVELVWFGLAVAVLIAIPLGVWAARREGGFIQRLVRAYSLMAGSQPDYWWGLVLVFVFFVYLKVAPGPVGRLPIGLPAPARITGSYVLDSILTGNWVTLHASLSQLILPIATIVIVYMPSVLKMTLSSCRDAMDADSIRLMRASGVGAFHVSMIILRLASPPIVTTVGIAAAYLLGAAALIETVFGINGAARYAVKAAIVSDYPGMQGVVLAIASLAALAYLATDIVQVLLDPRLRSAGAE
jgi:ABC-type dipeptide/oligopeptide/nickel transport system permease component